MLQNILNCEWSYFIVMIIFCIIVMVHDEKENDILGKKLRKKLWRIPITIEYKGRKLTIDRKEECFKSSYLNCRYNERTPKKYTYFINGNPVACITEIKYTLRKHYFTTLNYAYDTSDFKNIVKEAIKEDKRQDKIWLKEQLNNDNSKVKLYELVSQGDSDNGNG